MRPRIAIIYSGQMRSNSLNEEYIQDKYILDSTTKYFLTPEFSSKYDYDIFISTDTISVDLANDFFGDHLKNIHITETNWFLNKCDKKILDWNFFLEKNNKNDYSGYQDHSNALYQYYRMYCAYKMMRDYMIKTDTNYDYLIRIRPDLLFMQPIIMPLLNLLETTNTKIIQEHEQLCIMKYELKNIFKYVNFYGTYRDPLSKKQGIYHFLANDKNALHHNINRDSRVMFFAPERQFVDHVYYVMEKANMNFYEEFIGITYSTCHVLYRGNDTYGYISNIKDWKPVDAWEKIINYKIIK